MELVSWVAAVALAFSTTGVEDPAAGAYPSLPEPISTGQTLFSIPFQVEPSPSPDQEPTEVQLHVSVDRGATWHLYSKVEPKRGYFLFRAGGDGEFWFLIRTLDRAGQLRPPETSRPGLRVIVDTAPPKLDLKAQRGVAGQVTANWQVDDPNVDLATLKVQYRTNSSPTWQLVAVDHQRAEREGDVSRGDVTWWVPSEVARVEIRAEVADTADNPTVTHAQVGSEAPPATPRAESRTADVSPQPDWRPSADPPASPAWESRSTTAQPEPDAGLLTGADPPAGNDPPQAARRAYTIPPSRYADGPMPSTPGRYGAAPRPGSTLADTPPANAPLAGSPLRDDPLADSPLPSRTPPGDRYAIDAVAQVGRPTADAPAAARKKAAALAEPPRGAVAIQIHPPIGNRFVPPEAQAVDSDTWGVPPGETVRVVHSRVFELEYDVESVGPSGIARVELWGTVDKGRTWSSFGIDNDNKSPLLVTVPEEGLYGFRVAVRNGAGLGGKKPRAGDKPEVWVAVDQTEPSAQILTTDQSGSGQVGQLIVRWKADDRMLADRPVSLFYSNTLGGPWSPIAKGLDNSGQYAWSLDRSVPQRVYLRLEVRDRAGNLGISETSTAVSLDQLRPVVRIRDVRPLDRSAQSPRVYFR